MHFSRQCRSHTCRAEVICALLLTVPFSPKAFLIIQGRRNVIEYHSSTRSIYQRPNPSKTQVCAFRLRNGDAKRELNVVWNEIRLINTATPVYLVIHLDRTLSYKVHIQKTKMKENARTNIIRKLKLSRPLLRGCRIRLSCLGKE